MSDTGASCQAVPRLGGASDPGVCVTRSASGREGSAHRAAFGGQRPSAPFCPLEVKLKGGGISNSCVLQRRKRLETL